MNKSHLLKVALSQISPVWFNKNETLKKVKNSISEAIERKTDLIVLEKD